MKIDENVLKGTHKENGERGVERDEIEENS